MARIDVAFAADQNYLLPLAASVRSVIDNAMPDDELTIHLILSGVTASQASRLRRSWNLDRASALFYTHGPHVIETLVVKRPGSWTTANFLPLVIPRYLPHNVCRVLYLDADTITFGSLRGAFEVDLHNRPLAAVIDPHTRVLGAPDGVQVHGPNMDPRLPYFNAGVMTIDLSRWRKLDVESATVNYLRDHGQSALAMEQEALNWFFEGDFEPLDSRWNVMNYWEKDRNIWEYPNIFDSMVVRHYESRAKPWLTTRSLSKSQAAFFDYVDRTDWSGWRPPHLWPNEGMDA